jgi:hypothetical protein
VSLYERRSGTLRQATVTAPDGTYEFLYVAPEPHFVVAFDDQGGVLNAAISDYITPEPMG